MNMKKLIEKSERYVLQLLKVKLDKGYYFHTMGHTLNVVRNIKLIAAGENLSEHQTDILILAGLFHDTGYTIS